MATLKQKRAVKKLMENRGMAVSRAMIDPEVGYDETTAKNPKNLTDSKGFQDEMTRYGLTDALIAESLVDDIKAKPKKRFLELSLGAEILGMKKRPIENAFYDQRSINIFISPDKDKRIENRTVSKGGE